MKDEIENWMEKIKSSKIDLSSGEDLSIALMNLISIEEHAYFSAMKTSDKKYLNILHAARELRKKLLPKIVKDPKGEEWCISKHLLASSMRLIEVGTKEYKEDPKDAEFLFQAAFELYSLFWAINTDALKAEPIAVKATASSRISEIIKKILDCCKE